MDRKQQRDEIEELIEEFKTIGTYKIKTTGKIHNCALNRKKVKHDNNN